MDKIKKLTEELIEIHSKLRREICEDIIKEIDYAGGFNYTLSDNEPPFCKINNEIIFIFDVGSDDDESSYDSLLRRIILLNAKISDKFIETGFEINFVY